MSVATILKRAMIHVFLLLLVTGLSAAQTPAGANPSLASPVEAAPKPLQMAPPPAVHVDDDQSEDEDLVPELLPPLPSPPALRPDVPPVKIQSSEIIRVILGLAFLFGLAYIGGTSKARAIEQRLQITSVVTAGLPFVVLGAVAHTKTVGILSDSVLWELQPLLALGLGWIGFTAGFRVDPRLTESIVPGTEAVSIITSAVPFLSIFATCALLLVYVEHSPANAIFVRDAVMLGTAGAMTAYTPPSLRQFPVRGRIRMDRVGSIITLEQLAGFIGLLIVAAYFRPYEEYVTWQLPGTAWLFITLGMGTMMGAVIWGILANTKAGPEFMVLVLGSVCFTAGMASYVRLSPLVVCFIVGLILVNLPGESKDRIREVLEHMERPVYLLFLLIAGSLWEVTRWQGWALMLLFIPARLFGKWLAVKLSNRKIPGGLSASERRSLVFSPMGALSIAIVVNAQDLYFGAAVSWMVTAVIGGAIVTEVIVQLASRRNIAPEQTVAVAEA